MVYVVYVPIPLVMKGMLVPIRLRNDLWCGEKGKCYLTISSDTTQFLCRVPPWKSYGIPKCEQINKPENPNNVLGTVISTIFIIIDQYVKSPQKTKQRKYIFTVQLKSNLIAPEKIAHLTTNSLRLLPPSNKMWLTKTLDPLKPNQKTCCELMVIS